MKQFDLFCIAQKYGINPKALINTLKADGIKRKSATEKEVFDCIFLHCTELMYCRLSEFDGMVEYADTKVLKMLVDDMRRANNG